MTTNSLPSAWVRELHREEQASSDSLETDLVHRASGSCWRSVVFLPLLAAVVLLLVWDLTVQLTGSELFPRPMEVWWALEELASEGLLLRYIVASLFRVLWGFSLAVLVGVPLGLFLGWSRRAHQALDPLIQAFRPISPIAWIPIAILWFGTSNVAPIFLIFLASVFPITVSTTAAFKNVQAVRQRAAQRYGVEVTQSFREIVSATLPQILTGLRIALGVAWLVMVAAEMVGVHSGLGYLIIDARSSAQRYDLVVAAMVVIGLIGWLLDLLMRLAVRLETVRWNPR